MAEHRPVMLDEALAGLALSPGGLYVDATFGRGGHSGAILERLGPEGRLHALDRDPEACAAAQARFGAHGGFAIHRRNFAEIGPLGRELGIEGKVNGLLLDLGVSSPQLDQAERGFSFAHDGPLDMRMDPDQGISAAQWLASASAEEIADVLFRYGEERASRRIARRIVDARVEAPLERTAQLAELIAKAVPGPRQKIHPATRSFQGIRIFINQELQALEAALSSSVALLAPGGRLAVIAFHSLEDRIVKRFLRGDAPLAEGGRQPAAPTNSWRRNGLVPPTEPTPASRSAFKSVGRYFPTEEEADTNRRARSAVLRVAERLP